MINLFICLFLILGVFLLIKLKNKRKRCEECIYKNKCFNK